MDNKKSKQNEKKYKTIITLLLSQEPELTAAGSPGTSARCSLLCDSNPDAR